jgi:diadenosine tetraphosphatase ApaH/serine/threonine PP2A family protein phosphatase
MNPSGLTTPPPQGSEEAPAPAVEYPVTRSEHARRIERVFDAEPAHGKYVALIAKLLAASGPGVTDTISAETVAALCTDAADTFKQESTCVDIVIGEQPLVVAGDIHGQFTDLVGHVLPQVEAIPGGQLLCLGDYVDRGPQSTEVLLLLFALKVEFPDRIYLLRGNHEDAVTSRLYGFWAEVHAKYRGAGDGDAVWGAFHNAFCHIPLGALASTSEGKRFFCLHGGLSPGLVSINSLDIVERSDYGSMLDNESSTIADGAMWSDPTSQPIRYAASERGCGFSFGPMVTQDFCNDNRLEFICRAHQMTMEGYSWTHGQQCLTLFSAPNYCGMAGNLGAVMIADDNLALSFVTFDVAPTDGADAEDEAGGEQADAEPERRPGNYF